ncbi:flagellar biogenesis protein FliO [Rhizobium leguminosarum]
MLDDVVGAYGSRFLLAAGGVGLALLLLIIVLWVIRSRAPSPFVRGGRNRQPRLQVLDAAAVDARRRLVLVRRDDVEHLIMIGGPSDIVIESRILPAAAEQPESASRPQPVEQRPISVARPETPPISPPRPPVAARVEPAAEPTFSAPVSPEPRPRPEQSAQPPAPPAVAPPVVTSPLPAEPVTAPLLAERDNPLRAVPPQPRPPERPRRSPSRAASTISRCLKCRRDPRCRPPARAAATANRTRGLSPVCPGHAGGRTRRTCNGRRRAGCAAGSGDPS